MAREIPGPKRGFAESHPQTQRIIDLFNQGQKDFVDGKTKRPPKFAVIGRECGADASTVRRILRRQGLLTDEKPRLERDSQGGFKGYPRKDEFIAFVRESVSNVMEAGAAVFPSVSRLIELFDGSANTHLRIIKEKNMMQDYQEAKALAYERRLAERDARIVDWFVMPPPPDDTDLRLVSQAEIIFGLNRTTITEILKRAGAFDQVRRQTKAILVERNEQIKAETIARNQRKREEREEDKKFELEPSEELAWFLGVITAGGSMLGPRSNPTGVSFSLSKNIDEGVLAAIQSSSKRFLRKQGTVKDRRKEDKGIELHFDHTGFARWLGPFNGGERADTLSEKRYEWLVEGPLFKSFLEGIVDVKGYINKDLRKAYIYILKGTTQRLVMARFYRKLLLNFGFDDPYLYQRRNKKHTAMGIIIYNKSDLHLFSTLQSKSPEKQEERNHLWVHTSPKINL